MRIGRTSRPSHTERWLLWLGLVLPFGLLTLLWWQSDRTLSSLSPDLIYCSAEHRQDKQFTQGKHHFGGGQYQSTDQARSGRHAVRLPGDGKMHYAFTYEMTDPSPGGYYRVTVWKLRDSRAQIGLNVQGEEGSGFTHFTSQPLRIEGDWQEVVLYFYVPFGENQPRQLSIFVSYRGPVDLYVDDFSLEVVDHWGEQAFRAPTIDLRIDRAGWRKLAEKRDAALRAGLLQSSDDDWVAAEFVVGDTVLEADVRLKGDWLDHLRGDKWSFRVKLKQPATWRGMRIFSLHTPVARHYLHEWVLHRLWRAHDVLTPRYDFAELRINGESRGIYAYEEHFTKQLIERQKRRDGPIVRLSETGYWSMQARQQAAHGYNHYGAAYPAKSLTTAPVEAFEEDRWQQDSLLRPQWERAVALLAGYRDGQLAAREVFDIDRLAIYYAACDIARGYHGIAWHNQRFYYNPITTRLEPIGFDGYGGDPAKYYDVLGAHTESRAGRRNGSLYADLMQDTLFMRSYLHHLYTMSQPDRLKSFVDTLATGWQIRRDWLVQEFPKYRYQLSDFLAEASYVHSLLLPITAVALRFTRMPDRRWAVRNLHHLPVELVGFGYGATAPDKWLEQGKWLPPDNRRQVLTQVQQDGRVQDFSTLRFQHEAAANDYVRQTSTPLVTTANWTHAFYRLPGVDTLLVSRITVGVTAETSEIAARRPTQSSANEHPAFNEKNGHWTLPPGAYQLTRDLVVPAHGSLTIAPGTRLDMLGGAAIISYAHIQAIGSEEAPIYITSTDQSGSLVVLQAPQESLLRHVTFEQLAELQRPGWALPGAVTFYESPVSIERCNFLRNRSEDGLNIVRTRFKLRECAFAQTASDAFDSDFCEGNIRACRFTDCTNDGMDFSGSTVEISECWVDNCGDKGISVGEDSDVVLRSGTILNSNIGLAAKDYSTLLVQDVTLQNCAIGFAVYQKKAEYGPAALLVHDYTATGVRSLHRVAPGNTLQLGDELVE